MTGLVEDEGRRTLGAAFWAVWCAGMLGVICAFAAGVVIIHSQLQGAPVAVAGGALVIAFSAALVGLSLLPRVVRVRRGLDSRMRGPQKRYMQRFLPAMAGYVILLLAAISFWEANHPTGALAWIVAIAPALPLLFAVRAIALLIFEEDDEVARAVTLHAFVWATCGTLAVCSVWGFLDMFGVVPHVELWAVFPIWAVCLFPAQVIAGRKFG
jgi:hypothetical protein